ncbi:tRNA glutamyl-Q(34) synthetase GluQRS [Thalassospiraceae bacterium LMO-JJ14]|nr:tRNA glutamyl-Q(34) synthetase GluQRS [Thalassospiraceae bacterium LMO-JJ14]
MSVITRFAPSPTGYLHLGHAYAALFAEKAARDAAGKFLLRIEDIDMGRCRPEFEQAIYDDLAWLGLEWEQPVRRQSEQFSTYTQALAGLGDAGLTYPCFCTRKDIEAEITAAGGAPHGPDGPVYPGICRHMDKHERLDRLAAGEPHAVRLDMHAALARTGRLSWTDIAAGTIQAAPERFGDVVLARKDTPTSYHLSVTLDDHLQGVTLVTRGTDLFEATDVHRVLQALMDLDVPAYHHHPLLRGEDGKRFAKRDKSLTLAALRSTGATPQDIRNMIQSHVPEPNGGDI